MDLTLLPADPAEHESPLLVLPRFRDDGELSALGSRLDARFGGALARALASGDLPGREGASTLFLAPDDASGPSRVLVLGVGARERYDAQAVRRYAGRAVRAAEERRLPRLTLHLDDGGRLDPELVAQAGTEGAGLAAWRFGELKTDVGRGEGEEEPTEIEGVEVHGRGEVGALERGLRAGRAAARGENLARALQSRPGNVCTPTHFAEEAERIADETGMELRVLGPREMEEEGMGALLAVASGSEEEPRLIVLEHRGGAEEGAPVALVGKGLTFDAGGISIKPSKGMEEMKFDMSGGAAVLGAMRAVAELDLPLHVVGVVPSSENLPSGSAVKPGDVVRTRSGKTVEVINTDAEGRLILADALSYVTDTYRPAAVVDCATLTGACVVALGHHASGLLGTDEALVEEVRSAGERSGERCWPLPLWDDYRKQLDSESADLQNVGGRPAGAVTAGRFLREFVGDTPWAHLDIAGTAYGEEPEPYLRKGGYGVPTRLLLEWVRSRVG